MLTSLLPMTTQSRSLGQLAREVDRFFESAAALSSPLESALPARWPGLNAWQDGQDMFVEAEIPGFGIEDVEVDVQDDTLSIRGRREQAMPEGATPIRVERTVRSFERSLRLPAAVDVEAVEATLKSGVLRIRLPMAESAIPRRVNVRALEAGSAPRGALPERETQAPPAESA